jgi:hypothetical protein
MLILDDKFLSSDINRAFQLWNKYPWADNVPIDIFMNYLLPYKIYRENPADWRSFFMQKYRDTIWVILKELETNGSLKISNEIYYRILVDEVGRCFFYNDNSISITPHPGLTELMAVKSGNCYG